MTEAQPARAVVIGGGIAGLEAVLALRDLAPDQVSVALVAPEPEFVVKPLVVEEPFTHEPAETHELAPAMAELGVDLVPRAMVSVDPGAHSIELADGSQLSYDWLVVCVGGRARPAYEQATTFWSTTGDLPVNELIEQAAGSRDRTIALVVPFGTSWPLPLYELALMIRRRTEELGHGDLQIRFITPEARPLLIFGTAASDAVAELLRARRIEVEYETEVFDRDGLPQRRGGEAVEGGVVVALPKIVGPGVRGLPADEHGFIPVDQHGRVVGVDDVYAAGDGTNFPVKQGGLATQQADAAAEHIAARAGAGVDPQPFRPLLRGQLITGGESLNLRHELTGGHGEGRASSDYLWWPPFKVSGRYLAAWLGQGEQLSEIPMSTSPIEVEVSWPHEWHGEPVSFDAETPPPVSR
jgi:sulfide:quinone oxidoreductase